MCTCVYRLAGCRSIDKVINQLKVANREKGRVKLTLELTKVDLRNREQTIEELQRKLTLLEQRSIASQEIQVSCNNMFTYKYVHSLYVIVVYVYVYVCVCIE